MQSFVGVRWVTGLLGMLFCQTATGQIGLEAPPVDGLTVKWNRNLPADGSVFKPGKKIDIEFSALVNNEMEQIRFVRVKAELYKKIEKGGREIGDNYRLVDEVKAEDLILPDSVKEFKKSKNYTFPTEGSGVYRCHFLVSHFSVDREGKITEEIHLSRYTVGHYFIVSSGF